MTFLASCDEEDGRVTFEGPYYIGFTSNTATISEAGGSFIIEVSQVGPTLGSDITVNYTVEGSAQEGVDYTIVGGTEGTIVIPAGQHFGTLELQAIDDLSADGALNLKLTLSANSAGLENGRGAVEKTLSITITDDDCPIPPLEGDRSVETVETSPAGCSGVTNTVTITKVSDNADGSITYLLSDVTGGLYKNCYGDDDNPGEIVVNGYDITLTAQPDVVYGSDQFDGEGTINSCEGFFTLSWSNGYGDKGLSTFSL